MPAFRGHFSVQGSAVGGLSYKVKNPEAFTLPGAFSGINRKLFSVYRYMTAQQSS